jgi:hypothetical protein
LLVVPALFGTAISDGRTGAIWGTLRCLYRGPRLADRVAGLPGQPGAVMTGIPLIGGLRYDILGQLQGALERAGYQRDRSLHFFAYDWRLRSVEVAPLLVAEIRRLAAASDDGEVDLLGLSNGGLLVRAAFAAAEARPLPVGRVVTSGTPLAGSLETLACLHVGFQFAPLGRRVTPEEFVACPGSLDCLPAPDVDCFLADGDRHAFRDLYDVGAWRALRLSVFRARRAGQGQGRGEDEEEAAWTRVVTDRLRSTRESWAILGRAAAPRRLICICGAGLPTQVKIVVRDSKACIPGEGRIAGLPAEAVADGDGAVSVDSAQAWSGAAAEVVRIPVGRHRDVVRTPAAFRAIIDALS